MIAAAVWLMLVFSSIGRSEVWNGIAPLKSTRADVEGLLGRNTNDSVVQYKLKNQKVLIWYATADGCSSSDNEWNVPVNTVTSIHVFLNQATVLNKAPFDLTSFEKVRGDADLPNHYYYVNKQLGFGVETQKFADGRDMITGYLYGPSNADLRLRCRRA